MHSDDLEIAKKALDYLNENVGEASPMWQWTSSMVIENPEDGRALGDAVWQGDGYWAFLPRPA